GITYTQVAQYCVLIFAYLVPAIFISFLMTGNPVPQLGLGSQLSDGGGYMLATLDATLVDLGFTAFTEGTKSTIDIFAITAALMLGTAGLPHVIVRFFTVPTAADARRSAGWALVFIAMLYLTAPAVGAFARLNFVDTVQDSAYDALPEWFRTWEDNGLVAFADKDGDGRLTYAVGEATDGAPIYGETRGTSGERAVMNPAASSPNEVYVDRDIMVLALPEIAQLPGWVIALVAAGGLAAALSTAAGLLLVISTAVSHDLLKSTFKPGISERGELMAARIAAASAIVIAGVLGIYPPGWVAEVVAFAFGLAAASLFPAIVMGIFSVRMNREGAIAGMVTGLVFTFVYIAWFKFVAPETNNSGHWLFGISPEGIGTIGMLLNVTVAIGVSTMTRDVPGEVRALVHAIRMP
ncbi:MAG: VC_2705 family sodium/solute symporter, partial [Pacificimonas sp.]